MIRTMYWNVTVLGMIALGVHSLALYRQLRQCRTRRTIRRQQRLPISTSRKLRSTQCSSLDH
ncbi:MAG TPA: hypothetical protein VL134_04590 [Leptolyngbya sp.]|nr:hypothetical protein [Leptolyngbya sp.]